MRRFLITFIILVTTGLVMTGQPAFSQPAVTASIKPLQLIAIAIAKGVSQPALVLDSSQDPHHPSLRPSQRRAMNEAAIFMWIGSQLEIGMEDLVNELESGILEVSTLDGITRQGVGNQLDPHLWLDTRNALLIADALAGELVRLDPGNAQKYRDNLAGFREKLVLVESEIPAILERDRLPAFAVYHDGYQYFEKQFGLSHSASFTRNEEVTPGIRQLLEIRNALDESDTRCIVVSPSVNTANLDNQLGREAMQYVVVDVLAHDIETDSDGYIRFMRQLAGAFASCRNNR